MFFCLTACRLLKEAEKAQQETRFSLGNLLLGKQQRTKFLMASDAHRQRFSFHKQQENN
ncbi:hypothetical protein DB29_00064 [Shouchella clausii]|nr:hypothetical protein DB29_00064 [Shouchella clausii]